MYSNWKCSSDPARKKNYLSTQYFKSTDEMFELFEDIRSFRKFLFDFSKCNLVIELGKYILPDFETPNGETEDDYLKKYLSKACIKFLVTKLRKIIFSRLDFELSVIQRWDIQATF